MNGGTDKNPANINCPTTNSKYQAKAKAWLDANYEDWERRFNFKATEVKVD